MVNVVWFYGISGSGKTTAAELLASGLTEKGIPSVHLDAEALRATLWPELGTDRHGRLLSADRITSLSRTIYESDINVIISASAPFEEQRCRSLEQIPDLKFIHVDTPLETCKGRKPFAYRDSFVVTEVDIEPVPYLKISGNGYSVDIERQIEHIIGLF